LLPLAQALAAYRREREAAPDFWEASWLPFMTSNAYRLYVDCNRRLRDGDSPVRLVSWEADVPDADRALSLTHAVTLWVWLLESDYYSWQGPATLGHWINRDLPEFAFWSELA
jgi:hypothetical protein